MSKLKERAIKIIRERFPEWEVYEDDIDCVTGFWKRVDVYRWQIHFRLKKRDSRDREILRSVGCWETLSSFVKEASINGVYYNEEYNEIGAKEI